MEKDKLYMLCYRISKAQRDYYIKSGLYEYMDKLGDWVEEEMDDGGVRFIKTKELDVERVTNDLKKFALTGVDMYVVARVYEDDMCTFLQKCRDVVWIKRVGG